MTLTPNKSQTITASTKRISKISLVAKKEKRPSMPASTRFKDGALSQISVVPDLNIRDLVGNSHYESYMNNQSGPSLSTERQNKLSMKVGSLLNLRRKHNSYMIAKGGNDIVFSKKYLTFKTNENDVLNMRIKIKSMRNEKFANQLLLASNDSLKKFI